MLCEEKVILIVIYNRCGGPGGQLKIFYFFKLFLTITRMRWCPINLGKYGLRQNESTDEILRKLKAKTSPSHIGYAWGNIVDNSEILIFKRLGSKFYFYQY